MPDSNQNQIDIFMNYFSALYILHYVTHIKIIPTFAANNFHP